MHARLTILALGLAVLLGTAQAVEASLGPPVSAKLVSEFQPAKAGVPQSEILEITAYAELEIVDLRIEGGGWTARQLDAPSFVKLSEGETLRVAFEAVPSDPNEFLTIQFDVNGRPHTVWFDRSPKAYERSLGAMPTREVAPTELPPERDDSLPRPSNPRVPSPHLHEGVDDDDLPEKDELGPAKARTIRVRGRFGYHRDDLPITTTVGGDGVWVQVMDDDPVVDDLLVEGATDAWGYYDFTFTWDPCGVCESQPDIFVRFELNTNVADMMDTGGDTYSWKTTTWGNYTGSDLNVGTRWPLDEGDHPAVHIYTDTVRNWRWLNSRGYNCRKVDVIWPVGGDGASYFRHDEHIEISHDHEWGEGTHAHEYGHHWTWCFATLSDPDYCNGICDKSPTDCGHCFWCQENEYDAFKEGIANWMGDVIPRSFDASYGLPAAHGLNLEGLRTCDGVLDDPRITEGFVSALLRDMEDSANDNHPEYPNYSDALSLGTNEILEEIDLEHPETVASFLVFFKDRFPAHKEDLWETAKNCGYDMDGIGPGAVSGLTSTSHTPFESSIDNTIAFTWTGAWDNWSGIDGYGFDFAGAPILPNAIRRIFGDVTTYTSYALSPGTYYFSIRAVDREGNWSGEYRSVGPYIIAAAGPADLGPAITAGWTYPTIPRASANSTMGFVPVPTTLPGNDHTIYWNALGMNSGESGTGRGFETWLYLDGAWYWWEYHSSIGAGEEFYELNCGPMWVKGGRHTFEACYDADGDISETDETNNRWARQWIWEPLLLTYEDPEPRSSPPDPTGGWDAVDGVTWYNCEGLRMDCGSDMPWWNAVTVRSYELTTNYDCRLHAESTGAEDGFASNVGWSNRGPGLLDAVIVNRNVTGNTGMWDVGVLDPDDGEGNFKATHRGSLSHPFGTRVTYPLVEEEMLILREFRIYAENLGPVTISVDVDPVQGPVWLLWLDQDFSTGDLMDYSAWAITDPVTGEARLNVDITEIGYHCALVYRDPEVGIDPMDVTLEIGATPPDFRPYLAAGWHSPLVPRPADDGTISSVPAPTVLYGNANSTYLNVGITNDSPAEGSGLFVPFYLDGVDEWSISYGTFPGGGISRYNWASPHTVRGGRHTLSVVLDPNDTITEIYESNNIYGEQWVWTPLLLDFNVPVRRTMAPDRIGGWEHLEGVVLWYNCDGARSEEFRTETGMYNGFAVMPGDASNVDIRIHEVTAGTKNGYQANLVRSSWGTGASDYVLVNNNLTPFREFDAGILRISGDQDFHVLSTHSTYLGSYPSGSQGVFTLDSTHIVNLHEAKLDAGVHIIRIIDRATDPENVVDWGATLHPADDPYLAKGDALPGGAIWLSGPTDQEKIATVEVPENNRYCLTVYKPHSEDLGKNGRYELVFSGTVTDVNEPIMAPALTELTGVYPNPFNPRTNITFEVARQGPVRLEIYNPRGNLVRVLVNEALGPGRYRETWDGVDDAGRRVASGVYMASLTTTEGQDQRKLVMVK